MKKFIKNTLSVNKKSENDLFTIEKRWTKIYLLNKQSSFYKNIKSKISKIPPKNFVIEYGSSIGIITNKLSLYHKHVFGIDTSFSALHEAKKKSPKNCEYILGAITLNHIISAIDSLYKTRTRDVNKITIYPLLGTYQNGLKLLIRL